MEIVVNDTNILIDLSNAGLLQHCKILNLDFRTLDFVMEEISDAGQLTSVQRIIDDGTLKVHSLDGAMMRKVFEKIAFYEGKSNISPTDASVMVYAKENDCRLLTGDKKLRTTAENENVKVSGILFIIDLMIGKIDNKLLLESLESLLKSNNRLPKNLIEERIEKLK